MDSRPNPPGPHGSPSPDDLDTLREAVRLSPDNAPLRQQLGEKLLESGLPDEAEKEFRRALALAPDRVPLKIGLARAFLQLGKRSHALVLIEDIVQQPGAPALAFLLHARLLFHMGETAAAVAEYRRAIDLDPAAADPELASQLGFNADPETSERIEGRLRARAGDAELPQPVEVERPRLTFADVGGMDDLKEEIRLKIIYPITRPEIYQAYGKSIGGGILTYGPPGCGKTFLARATAGEIRAGFISVGIHDVLDMWIGNSERNLHELFEQARAHRPCVLFFDEADALGASRGDMRQHAGRQLINQFLAELDGVQSSNEGVLILAATNAPWHLDAAFRRPGRFDRILFVPPPDAAARAAILRLLCRGKPVADIDFEHLARRTDHFSGADLKAVVDVAIEKKLREAMQSGAPAPLSTRDLAQAAATLKPTTREWFATARNYALYANQGGLYDDILKFMGLA